MEFKDIMRRIVEEDKSLLARREDFLAALEAASNSPKDYQAVRRAAISTNICEMFLANDEKDIKGKEDTIKSVRKKLADIGMQDARIDFLIDAFVYALNWDMGKDEVEAEIEEITPAEEVKVSLQKSWKCSCGSENTGNFCSACGKKRGERAENNNNLATLDNVDEILQETEVPKPLVQVQSSPINLSQNAVTVEAPYINATETQEIQTSFESMPSYEPRDVRNVYLTFEGRLNRWACFILCLKNTGLALLALIVVAIAGAISDALGGVVAAVLYIGLSIVGLSITVRRWHDLDKSGWYALLGLIPYVNFIVGLYLLFAPGTDGPNQYGPAPLKYQ